MVRSLKELEGEKPGPVSTDRALARFVLKKWGRHVSGPEYTERARRVLLACEKDGYARSEKDIDHTGDLSVVGWQVTETHGDNLLVWSYYWFRYIPQEFPSWTRFLISIAGSFVVSFLTTSGILWILLSHLGID